ncbi:MAG: leucine-rich repeat protein [Clostridia bacterium]|nr:leucine-rich repeat protein [Clostridia bacterium]
MKKRILAFVLCIILIASMNVFALPVSAEVPEPQYPGTYNADTYYYDRIPERAQWCYNWLKDFYDNMPKEEADHKVDISFMLPENPDDNDVYELAVDFLVADAALKADDPSYRYKGGRVSGWAHSFPQEERQYCELSIVRSDLHSKEAIAVIEARTRQIVEIVGDGDRYTKLRKLTAYIIDNVFYDPYLIEINDSGYDGLGGRGIEYNGSVYGALVKNIAVCGGFADTVKHLCNELDIPCIIMGNAAHAWNLVQMDDGGWYRIDITGACRLGWDGDLLQTVDEYAEQEFLNNNTFIAGFGMYDDPYMLNIDNVFRVTDFPPHAEAQYKYTGDNTDFSYEEVPLDYDFGDPQFIYNVNPDGTTCTIVDYAGEQTGDLIIPDKIDGYTVNAIGNYAFYYCTGFNGKLVIPKTVKTIGRAAFAGCYNLTSVEMSDCAIESIGDGGYFVGVGGEEHFGGGAFIGCKGLKEIVLPDSLFTIYKYAFYDCDSLASVSFGGHVVSIEENAFGECAGIPTLKAPSGSCVEEYASDNGLEFEVQGDLCSGESTDGKWYCEDNSIAHYQICEHGEKTNIKDHSVGVNCGDICDICGAYYCINYNYSSIAPTVIGQRPADCQTPKYTGDIVCRCGNTITVGEYVGDPASDAHDLLTEDWLADSEFHFHICSLGCRVDEAAHYGGTATFWIPARCVVCGQLYGECAPEEVTTDVPETDTPETDTSETDASETDASKTEAPNTEIVTTVDSVVEGFSDTDIDGLGCGGVIGGAYAVIVAVAASGIVLLKKRDD